MKVVEVRSLAARKGVVAGKLNKGDLIRAIQTKEGNEACFDTGKAKVCGQTECLWRDDCK
ncbi:MAG TPA: SAP domain-containing protein [Geobacteraceae bacterium]|jgi:hypothetical protein|nr:SAP domain-containing protein [Geobacteraceae bacterium]